MVGRNPELSGIRANPQSNFEGRDASSEQLVEVWFMAVYISHPTVLLRTRAAVLKAVTHANTQKPRLRHLSVSLLPNTV